jgi:hypothetical protein
MEHSRIIRLDDSVGTTDEPRVATFEEAFGEYSEARGRGRARRAARREDRQVKKAERKVGRQTTKQAKIAAKQDTRQLRRGGRQEARIGRRATRKGARQDIRADQQAARMGRRMERKRQRQDRKDEVADREMDRELRMAEGQQMLDQYASQNQGYDDGGYDDGGYDDGSQGGGGYDDGGYDDGGYDDGGYGGGSQGGGSQGGGSQGGGSYGGGSYGGGSQGGGSYYEEDWGDDGYGGWNDYDDYEDYGDGDYNYEDDYGFGDEDYGDGGWNFEGETGLVTNEDPELEEAQKIADKIEWNKKLIENLSFNGNSEEVATAINKRNTRIEDLKCQMRDFVSFDGDYFDDYEDESFVGADGRSRKVPMKGAIKRRMQKANKARGLARSKAGFGKSRGRKLGQKMRPTLVKGGIGAEIQNNRIVIPATSNATGITAIDDNDDYGYSPTEIQLGFDGDKKGMSTFTKIAIGLGIGVLAIVILKKTKVL